MNVITRPTLAALLLLSSTLLVTSAVAQQKRPTPARTQPRPSVAPTPPPTFETLVPADRYTIYSEVRGVGQLIQSNTLNEFLEPILKLAGPPKELRTVMKWLTAHADEITSSRLLVATWPRNKEVPETLVAIEFASAEEAAKFATPLNEILPTVLPPTPASSPEKTDKSAPAEKPTATAPPKPNFNLQRFGSLILITEKPITLKQLKPSSGKLLFDDSNFRTARNRLNSEPIFVYIDVKSIEREEEERRKQYEEENKKRAEAAKAKLEQAGEEDLKKKYENPSTGELTEEEEKAVANAQLVMIPSVPTPEAVKEPQMSADTSLALTALGMSLFGGQSDWPDAVGLALSFDDESFVLRGLLVNPPGEKSDVVPFMPILIPGAPLVPEAPNILPADTELFATMSLDLPQIYATLAKPRSLPPMAPIGMHVRPVNETETESEITALEKQLKINIKDDLLPLIGSEIAVRLPAGGFDFLGIQVRPSPNLTDKDNSTNQQPPTTNGPVIFISLKDREGMRALMPKLIDSLGIKGASSFAQTERREDTELVSFANLFSYAFVGNFLVLSDPATTRHVIDSYLKHETLAGDSHYKNYTRWQPRSLHGQLYISPALMESYKTWVEQPSTRISDQTRAYLTRLSAVAQPITYSLSNEGFGPLHELHLPKNLVLMAVIGMSSEANPPKDVQNERMTVGTLYMIAHVEEQYKAGKGAGSYGTLEQLIEADLFRKEMIENNGYKIELTATGDKFEVSAVPVEYGKSGSMSYFIDQTRVLRGGDRNGASATSSDPPIY